MTGNSHWWQRLFRQPDVFRITLEKTMVEGDLKNDVRVTVDSSLKLYPPYDEDELKEIFEMVTEYWVGHQVERVTKELKRV